jgi:hypothetical protein
VNQIGCKAAQFCHSRKLPSETRIRSG